MATISAPATRSCQMVCSKSVSQFASRNVGPSWFDIFPEARSDRQAGTASVITLEHFLNLSIQRRDGARYSLFLQSTNNLCGGHSLAFRSKILLQRRYLAGLEQYILSRNSLFAFSTKHAASFF